MSKAGRFGKFGGKMAPQDMVAATDSAGREDAPDRIGFATHPDRYRHWKLSFEGNVARLALDVSEAETLKPGYTLKLNSYDLGVDIELYDAIQRLRFEHPEIGCVVLCSNKPGVFCAGANIRMLGLSTHDHKVNFCKFTNETRNGITDPSLNSRQTHLCPINRIPAARGAEHARTDRVDARGRHRASRYNIDGSAPVC